MSDAATFFKAVGLVCTSSGFLARLAAPRDPWVSEISPSEMGQIAGFLGLASVALGFLIEVVETNRH